MYSFYKKRVLNPSLVFAFVLLSLISFAHLFLYVYRYKNEPLNDLDPYVSSLPMSFGSPLLPLFMLILPLGVSFSCSGLFLSDKKNNLLNSILLHQSRTAYFWKLGGFVFATGFLVVLIPLIFNIIGTFMLLPNNLPDEVINHSRHMNLGSALFVKQFYTHPSIQMLLNLLLISFFGGLFAFLSFSFSFLVKKIFLVYVSTFIIQLFLIFINLMIYPQYAIAPAFFLPGNPWAFDINGQSIIINGIGMLFISCFLLVKGSRRYENL